VDSGRRSERHFCNDSPECGTPVCETRKSSQERFWRKRKSLLKATTDVRNSYLERTEELGVCSGAVQAQELLTAAFRKDRLSQSSL